MTDGIVVIDKPLGMTSHDVVSRLRRCLGIRRIGHAGTLDPDASGVLVLGVGKATRLLTYLVGDDKDYDAVIRLGASTVTDDAAGDVLARCSPQQIAAVSDELIRERVADFIGVIDQRPSAVSAVKVDGQRSYARVRAGEQVELPTRRVTVSRFDVLTLDRADDHIDVSVQLTVSSGTYVRALARDLGQACGVGGHVRSLRRTRSGDFSIDQAQQLPESGESIPLIPLATAMRSSLSVLEVTAEQASALAHGRRITVGGVLGEVAANADQQAGAHLNASTSREPARGQQDEDSDPRRGVVGVVTSTGTAVAVCRWQGHELAPDIVFV